jgi:hypothetical protein
MLQQQPAQIDKHLRKLVSFLNNQIIEIRKDRLAYTNKNSYLKNAI